VFQKNERTTSGLYLPPTRAQEKEKMQQGYIIKQARPMPFRCLLKMNHGNQMKSRLNIFITGKGRKPALFL